MSKLKPRIVVPSARSMLPPELPLMKRNTFGNWHLSNSRTV